MKINEVSELVGVTKRNIRYYEEEGLLRPRRDSRNGYREYGEEEVEALREIKLLRKLEIPIEEIRRMQEGGVSVREAMERQGEELERKRGKIGVKVEMCRELAAEDVGLGELDVEGYLEKMEEEERGGRRYEDIEKREKGGKYVGAIVGAVVMVVMMVVLEGVIVWGCTKGGEIPEVINILLIGIPIVVIVGVMGALRERVEQIKGGEEDEASKY